MANGCESRSLVCNCLVDRDLDLDVLANTGSIGEAAGERLASSDPGTDSSKAGGESGFTLPHCGGRESDGRPLCPQQGGSSLSLVALLPVWP